MWNLKRCIFSYCMTKGILLFLYTRLVCPDFINAHVTSSSFWRVLVSLPPQTCVIQRRGASPLHSQFVHLWLLLIFVVSYFLLFCLFVFCILFLRAVCNYMYEACNYRWRCGTTVAHDHLAPACGGSGSAASVLGACCFCFRAWCFPVCVVLPYLYASL